MDIAGVSAAMPRRPRHARAALLAACTAALAACAGLACRGAAIGGPQSSLAPAGHEADRIASLFWWMAGGAVIAWLAVIALTFYTIRPRTGSRSARRDHVLIIGGGAIVPTIVLTLLLVDGLAMLPGLVAPAPEGSLRVVVTGEQWWWRVRYLPPDGEPVELANEIRLPVGKPAQFLLQSDNVIHSFWIPSLGGKMDMIPGRVTSLALHPTTTGIFRGACAEYCGTAHALMSFYVEVMEADAFSRWLAQQAQPARVPVEPIAARGRDAFLANGCGACHAVAGTAAAGVIGPDLTHVGSRLSLGAGILANEPDAFHRWIARTDRIKAGVHMPRFGMLPDDELRALAAYLEGLQ